MSRLTRALVVLAYGLVFWIGLPLLLVFLGRASERALALAPLAARPLAGGALALVGAALLASAIVVLRTQGRGLPVSALPPPRLVVRGPYLLCRHPIYLGFHLGLWGLALAFGEAGLALIITPAFLPAWLAYALVEERGLLRRFGDDYHRYRRHVGLLPRFPWYRAAWVLGRLLLDVRREGMLPKGPFVIVANHRCYLDPFFLAASMWPVIRFPTTAEVFRVALLRPLLRRARCVCVRRYRTDVIGAREVRRLLAEGENVGLFVEGERSVAGGYLGCPRDVGRYVAALTVPVVPCALVGNYDAGPRFSDVLRRRKVTVRFGAPVVFSTGAEPAQAIDNGIRALLSDDPAPVHLEGLSRAKLARVLWACPRCFAEPFDTHTLRCNACTLALTLTVDGRLAAGDDVRALAGWCAPLFARARAGEDLADDGELLVEKASWGAPAPLASRGPQACRLDARALVLGDLVLDCASITRVTTERADTVEIARGVEMWQLKPASSSAFRWCMAIEGRIAQARAHARAQTEAR